MDTFTQIEMESPSPSTGSVAGTYFGNATARRVDTSALLLTTIENKHPGVPVTIVPEFNCDLKAYAEAGHASIEVLGPSQAGHHLWPDSLKWTFYNAPSRRLDGGNGTIVDEVLFEAYTYRWKNMEFLVYLARGSPNILFQYILGDEAAVRTLLTTVGHYQSSLHDQIWVFNKGYWQKDRELYQSIMKSRWEDVILDRSLKEDLVETIQQFYDSKDQYNRLRVPWKRGIIFYGPPGNGKTVSIKATMHTLYQRKPPIPTLYVKSFVGFAPAEYSIERIFDQARKEAPCYLVFEDIDSLVTDRVRSFFLNAVDGLSENEGILIVGSTNHIDRLDPGLAKRPSRFDRKYLFPDPDFDKRVQYCKYWQEKLKDNKDIEFPDKVCPAAAKITDGFSFAYIQEAFVSALMAIAREQNGKGMGEAVVGLPESRDDSWEVLEVEDGYPITTGGKDKDLDDYILWRKLKQQIELLRKEISREE